MSRPNETDVAMSRYRAHIIVVAALLGAVHQDIGDHRATLTPSAEPRHSAIPERLVGLNSGEIAETDLRSSRSWHRSAVTLAWGEKHPSNR